MADIVKDIERRYTSRANPRRGYHDSEDIITFSGGTKEEQQAFMDQYRRALEKNNYMWLGSPELQKENVWRINYGYDSGD